MARDWVTLASAVLEEGVKALVPGAGILVGLAGTAMEPEKDRLRTWREDKAQQKAFAKSVQAYGRRRGFGDADVEDGMAAAAEILRQRGASLELIAELNLDPGLTAGRVLAGDPYPLQPLGADARAVCGYAVEDFYDRFLLGNRPALDRAVQRVLLGRTDTLPDRVATAVWAAAPGIRADLTLRLDRIRSDYGLVGGRDRELRDLDRFLAGPGPSYLLLTGGAGMGKTALLVEWIRELKRAAAVTVVYHFISRQYGTASQLDLMTSLVAQAAAAWGERLDAGTLGATVPVLEAAWLDLLGSAPPGPVVIVVDGVDEAEAEGWQVRPLLFPPTLPGNVHVVVSARDVPGRNWPAVLGIQGAAAATVGRLSAAGVAEVLVAAGVPAWVREEGPLRTLVERTDGDPFYLRLLVDALQKEEVSSPEDLERAPAGLDDFLAAWWSELSGSAVDQAVQTLLGYLVVAAGPITRDELVAIDRRDALSGFTVDAALRRIGRFVVGDPGRTGVALAHWRLQSFAERRLAGELDAFEAALVTWCTRWREHHARYALVHLAGHLLRQAAGPDDFAALGALLADEKFQRARVEGADDAVGLLDDLDRLLARLAAHPDATVALLRAALEVDAASDRWLRPEAMIQLARQGRVGEAVRRLGLLGPQPVPHWHPAARLVMAWTAADEYPQSARDLLDGLDRNALWGPGVVLHGRVLARLGDGDEPELTMWFPPHRLPTPSDRYRALAGIERLGGAPAYERGISGLPPHELVGGDEGGIYLAEADAPHIVAYARDEPAEGDEWLSRYIDLHASNPYALYRNRSLLSVLAAVCCLPDADQARRHAWRLTAAAFAPSPVQFAEFARLALAGRRARSSAEAARRLGALVTSALQGADNLQHTRESADQWGHHARRLAAHAEVAHLVLGETARAVDVLDRAMQVPFGYAGYRAPASIAVAEAVAVVAPADVARREAALDSALTSAHNIQEPAFCTLMTARVNTIIDWWRSPPPDDLAGLVEAFVQDPGAARFSPRHRLGDTFERRSGDHLSVDHITALTSPRDVALDLGLPVLAVTRLTAEAEPGTVVLPDPGFAPMVAAHLAARAAASALPRQERIRLMAAVVPVAAQDVTQLDQVLGRLLCVRENLGAEGPAVEALLDRHVTREPTGAWAGTA